MINIISAPHLFFAALLVWLVGALGSLALGKNDRGANFWGNSLAIVGAILALTSATMVLLVGHDFSYSINSSFPLLTFAFHVDRLSAFFVFVIALIALLASVYAIGYIPHYYTKYNIGVLGFFYNVFLAGMVMVVTSHHAIFFLIVWELMSLASYFLVTYENKNQDNVRAGSLYFIMMHLGTAFITMAFLLLYRATGSFDFGVIKENIGAVPLSIRNVIFILALVGFGTKAGIMPFHIWLPSAHPAAPSHVSALMSGVMIKTGIYMLIRIFIGLMPAAPLWWGVVILILGAVSSLLGVLYALTEHDIKRLLAYHSIENIGIILLGLGSAMIFWSLDMKALANLALVASLFHTLNHAIFKSLLFMGAGSVIAKTHTRNMEEYGGLIKLMPATGLFFLVGSMAISALPPFNGFFSEWLTFQSLFAGIMSPNIAVRWAFVLAAGSLAFTSGLAAMCFVKAFGITFLARPRSEEAKHAKESGLMVQTGMAILAALTLVIGFAAGAVSKILSNVTASLDNIYSLEKAFVPTWSSVRVQDGFSTISTPFIFISLVAVIFLVFAVVAIVTRQRKIKISRTWDCGTTPGPRAEITATGFARSMVTIFRGVLKPTKQTGIEYRDQDIRYFPLASSVEFGVQDIYQKYFYNPIQTVIVKTVGHVKKIQSGILNMYVLYMFIILIILIYIASL